MEWSKPGGAGWMPAITVPECEATVTPAANVMKTALAAWTGLDAERRIQPARSAQEGDKFDVIRTVPCVACGQWGHGCVTCPKLWGPPQRLSCQECGQSDHEIWTCPVIWGSIRPSDDELSHETQRLLMELTTALERSGETDIAELCARTACPAVSVGSCNLICEVGAKPVGRSAGHFLRDLPLHTVGKDGEARAEDVCDIVISPPNAKFDMKCVGEERDNTADEDTVDRVDDAMTKMSGDYVNGELAHKDVCGLVPELLPSFMEEKMVQPLMVDNIISVKNACVNVDALFATNMAASEISLTTSGRLDDLEPEVSQDNYDASLLGHVEGLVAELGAHSVETVRVRVAADCQMTEGVNGSAAKELVETVRVRVAANRQEMGNGEPPSIDDSGTGAPVTQTAQVVTAKDWTGRKTGGGPMVSQCCEWKRTRKKLMRAVRGPVGFGLCVCSHGFRQRGRICGSARQCHWVKAYFAACAAIIQGLLIEQVCSACILVLLERLQGSSWVWEPGGLHPSQCETQCSRKLTGPVEVCTTSGCLEATDRPQDGDKGSSAA